MDLASWLRKAGLERYQPVLVENGIDLDVLAELTEIDLENIGLPLGDRKRMLRAVRTTLSAGIPQTAHSSEGVEAEGNPAERRQLTVMICDLVESTALSTRLDPEELRAAMNAYHAACSQVCVRYEGYVTEFRGDGIIAYFGYPHAHEDDAERTVRAGLEIIGSLDRIDLPEVGPLAIRIGIATGLVVVDESTIGSGPGERSLFGNTPNLAARLQTLAAPGTMVVSASTRRLLGDFFVLRDLGSHWLKGFAQPVPAWAVDGLAASVSRFTSSQAADLNEFVGRVDEMAFLRNRKRLAWGGQGQVILITGEPGIGKSRLAAEISQRLDQQSFTSLVFQCSPYHANTALHPVIAHLERAARFKATDTPAQRLSKLECLLSETGSSRPTIVPLLAGLLSIPLADRYPALSLSPAEHRRRMLSSMLKLLLALTRRRPVLLLLEDAHWADATSLELLEHIVTRVRRRRILALITVRQAPDPAWIMSPNVSILAISGLDRGEIERIATRVTGGRQLPAEVMRRIISKTDGNPLFAEELTKTVLESELLVEDGPETYQVKGLLPPLAIPATLQDSLMARLDRVSSMKRVAQIAAALGRDFSYFLLRAVVGGDEGMLLASLAQLEQAGLMFRHGELPDTIFTFKHALVRDAAYESLLRSQRQALHRQIADVLEQQFPSITIDEPEIVAHHLVEANMFKPAIGYLFKAGVYALRRSANTEAVEHLRTGLQLTHREALSPERAHTELEFQLALGPALAATVGYAASSTLAAFSRARELLGEDATLTEEMTVLWGTYLAHNMRAEHDESLDVARRCLSLAERHRHLGMAALANRFIGQTLNMTGELAAARKHFEETLALCSKHAAEMTTYRDFGIDDEVGALFNLGRTLLLLGYPDQSADAAAQAVARAQRLALPFTTALTLSHAAMIGILAEDRARVAAIVDVAITHSVHHGLLEPEQKSRIMKGALLAQSGSPEAGLAMMHEAMMTEIKAVQGATIQYRSLYLGLMADAHLRLGEPQAGLGLLHEAIAAADATGEKFYYAELHRLQSNMLLALGARAEAERSLNRALGIARSQGSRWFELRAATSLAALWQESGMAPQAKALLEPVCKWFSEGFNTKIVQEAMALLSTLTAPDRSSRTPTPAGVG